MTSNDPTNTREWLRGALARYEGPLIAYANRILGDVERSRDVVQDTFLKLWEADRGEVDGHLAQWLYTVCRNRAIDVRRREGRMSALSDEPAVIAKIPSASTAETGERACGVLDMLHALPDRQQEAVRLKFQGGLSYKEIGSVMDTTVSNVGVMIHTALKTLRQQLNSEQMDAAGSPGSASR